MVAGPVGSAEIATPNTALRDRVNKQWRMEARGLVFI
jgi:hypothetical protein